MPGSLSISGLASGLQTDEIIEKLVEYRQKAVDRLNVKKETLNTKLEAWQELNTRVLALKLKSDALANPNSFGAKSVTCDDEKIMTATAYSSAVTGTYYIKVKQIAMAHQVQSQGYADMSDNLGTGKLKITVNGKVTEVDIDANNSSLLGVKDAINRANAGVKAAIIDTGQAGSRYKLLITSNTTGTTGAVSIDVTQLAGGTAPTFTDLQAAQDAELEMGTGAGAIQITKSSNAVQDVIPGVTLNLKSADATRVLAVTVNQNDEAIRKTVNEFIEQYNNVIDYINEQFKYDQTTKQTGTLFGDFSLINVQMGISSATSNSVPGLQQTIKALSQIGIKTDTSGKLSVGDEFAKALQDTPDQVKALFSALGSTTDPNVVFISAGSATKETSTGYTVEVTRLATRPRITAGVAQTEALTASETLTINGKTMILDVGWTQQDIVNAINARSAELGVIASRTDANGQGTGDYLTLTSVSYGSSANLIVKSDTSNGAGTAVNVSGIGNKEVKADAPAGESGTGTGAVGYDVLGKINGVNATGSGQVLKATSGDAKDLRVMITGGEVGNRGVVTFSRGVGSILSNYLNAITDKSGNITTAKDTLNRQISDMNKEISDLNERLKQKEAQLYAQFMAMESALSKLQTQGQYISGLVASMTR